MSHGAYLDLRLRPAPEMVCRLGLFKRVRSVGDLRLKLAMDANGGQGGQDRPNHVYSL